MTNAFEAGLVELRKNIEAYEAMEQDLERDHSGRVALFHHGKFITTCNDYGDAYDIGCEKFGLGHFSITRIGEKPASLGAATLYVEPMAID